MIFLLLALRGSVRLFLCALICSLLHELGHYITARALGLKLSALTVYPFGADMTLVPNVRSYRTDIAVHISGPTVNLMLGAAGYMLNFEELFWVYNLALGAMNLLPVLGLDGGNALFALLSLVTDPDRAYGVLRAVTVVFSVILWVISVYVMLVLGGDPSMFFIAVLTFFTFSVRGGER